MEKKLFTLIVYSENIAGLLNQVTAEFTRRQMNIETLNVSSSSIEGVHRYTITLWSEEETIKKVNKLDSKKFYSKIAKKTMMNEIENLIKDVDQYV